MMDFFSSSEPWVQWVIAAGILALSILIAFLSKIILTHIVPWLTRRTKTRIDDLIIHALTGPIFIGLIFASLWVAITYLPEAQPYEATLHKVFIIIYIGIIAVAIVRITHALLSWYTTEIAPHTKSDFDDRLIPILRRVADVIVYAIDMPPIAVPVVTSLL